MTQREFAEAAGLNPSYISMIENNERRMTTETLDNVAKALRMPAWALVALGEKDVPLDKLGVGSLWPSL